jgi:hypothetical protein
MTHSRITHVFSVKKADNSTNFAAGGIMNRKTHHNLLCRDKNKYYVTSYVMVYKAMNHATLPRMHDLCPASTLVIGYKRRLLFEYPSYIHIILYVYKVKISR